MHNPPGLSGEPKNDGIMSGIAKTLVTVGVVVLAIILFAAVVGVRDESGHNTPGILGLIVFAGAFGAIKAIWKKDKESDDKNDNNTSILQK